jgi:hypothetical protein
MKNNKNSTDSQSDEERFDKIMYRLVHPQEGDSLVEAELMMERFRERMAKEKVHKDNAIRKPRNSTKLIL